MSLRCCSAELRRRSFRLAMVPVILALVLASPRWCLAQREAPQGPCRPQSPEKVGDVNLVRDLRTTPVPHDRPVFNVQMVDAALTPRDKEGIWVLDFAFKSLRIQTVDIPGQGRRQVHYLYYKVANRTGKPRVLVPEFIMVNEAGQKFEENVIPQSIPLIQAREDATIPLLGATSIMGTIPPKC
jgi:hypothetical protein